MQSMRCATCVFSCQRSLKIIVPLPIQALIVDCANGVGAQKLQVLAERLKGQSGAELRVDARNVDTSHAASLNERCGADFVQKERRLPEGFQGTPDGARHAFRRRPPLLHSACEQCGT